MLSPTKSPPRLAPPWGRHPESVFWSGLTAAETSPEVAPDRLESNWSPPDSCSKPLGLLGSRGWARGEPHWTVCQVWIWLITYVDTGWLLPPETQTLHGLGQGSLWTAKHKNQIQVKSVRKGYKRIWRCFSRLHQHVIKMPYGGGCQLWFPFGWSRDQL